MNEQLLAIYEKCMEHNISISMKYMLSDASIEVEGVCLAYNIRESKYEVVKYDKWVSIHEMRDVVNGIDPVMLAVTEIMDEIKKKKDELGRWV